MESERDNLIKLFEKIKELPYTFYTLDIIKYLLEHNDEAKKEEIFDYIKAEYESNKKKYIKITLPRSNDSIYYQSINDLINAFRNFYKNDSFVSNEETKCVKLSIENATKYVNERITELLAPNFLEKKKLYLQKKTLRDNFSEDSGQYIRYRSNEIITIKEDEEEKDNTEILDNIEITEISENEQNEKTDKTDKTVKSIKSEKTDKSVTDLDSKEIKVKNEINTKKEEKKIFYEAPIKLIKKEIKESENTVLDSYENFSKKIINEQIDKINSLKKIKNEALAVTSLLNEFINQLDYEICDKSKFITSKQNELDEAINNINNIYNNLNPENNNEDLDSDINNNLHFNFNKLSEINQNLMNTDYLLSTLLFSYKNSIKNAFSSFSVINENIIDNNNEIMEFDKLNKTFIEFKNKLKKFIEEKK